MKINWNGFLELAVKEYPKEVAGFLFSRMPYHSDEEWFVFPVKNISKSKTKWRPDRKETLKVKSMAVKLGLVKIGNVHTHPYYKEWGEFDEEVMKDVIQPSDVDLSYARRFNDIVRIIVCNDDKAVYDVFVHDKFGNKIDEVLI